MMIQAIHPLDVNWTYRDRLVSMLRAAAGIMIVSPSQRGFSLTKNISQGFINQFGRKKVGRVMPGLWQELDYVHADNLLAGGHGANERRYLMPIEAAGFRAFPWRERRRRVEAIEINGEVDARAEVLRNFRDQVFSGRE